MVPAQNFVSVSRRPPDVEDYIDMLRRYRSWIIGPMYAGLVISTVIAFFWPDTYISTAVMRITPPQVPETLVPNTVSSQMGERLQQMQTDILSRTSLAEIIQKPSLDLYKKERTRIPMEDIVQEMRNKYIKITPLADAQGRSGKFAAAFAISFLYTDRYKAQAVVRELVTKFTEQNVTVQRNQANLTTNFLTDELKAAKEKVDNLQEQLTKFKIQNMGMLPEQATSNAQALQTYQLQLMNTQNSLNRAAQDRIILETNLTNVRNSMNNAAANLEQTIAGVTSTSGPAAVENQKLIDMNRTLADQRQKLAAAKETFGSNHPDVQAAEASLQFLERERDALQKQETARLTALAGAVTTTTTPARVVQNPVVARQLEDYKTQQTQIQTQMATKQMEIESLKNNETQLEKTIAEYNRRLQSAPLNEQTYSALISELGLAKQNYEDMTKRHEVAETAQNIEEHKAGANLEVLDPASLPEQPAEPNRLAWAGIGTFAGLGLGIVLAAAQEVKNTSLKNLKDVRAYTSMPVLSSIPLLENALLVRRKRRLAWLAWSSAILIGCILMSGSMYYHLSGI
jgi:polysaccharide chain length determinant protein (PEP-CTERM system associated)